MNKLTLMRGATLGGLSLLTTGMGGATAAQGWIPGTSALIAITDCVRVERDAPAGVARIDRVLKNPRGYQWDAPGTRIRFRTDSASVAVHLLYSARHTGPARNGIGFYRIDGRAEAAWRFTRPEGGALPAETPLVLPLPAPEKNATGGRGAFHDYELILPYGDAVELQGVAVAAGARWETPAPRPAVRWVAFGDSVTQGFSAGDVLHTYPFLVGEAKGWQVINAGFGGRGTRAADGDFLAGLDAEVFTVAIGVNDWQGGTELETFRAQMTGLLRRLKAGRPRAAVRVVTPLWVPPAWKPEKAKYPLEDYRRIIREVAAGIGDGGVKVIEGSSLIDHDPALFDKVAVHPNDAGFAQMAERLEAALGSPRQQPAPGQTPSPVPRGGSL